jgi:glutathione transport system substrate-binding protein
MWLKAGVDLQIRRLEGGVYAADAFAAPSVKAAEGLGGVLASWSSGVVPELQLRPLFAARSAAPAGANLGFYQNTKIDALLDAAEDAQGPQARRQFYRDAQNLILDEAPAVMVYTRDDIAGARSVAQGLSIERDGVLTVAHAFKS